jgi:hypothetical protein
LFCGCQNDFGDFKEFQIVPEKKKMKSKIVFERQSRKASKKQASFEHSLLLLHQLHQLHQLHHCIISILNTSSNTTSIDA